ncbi:acoC [Symbiodinium sp. CCMP2456]|nr:acoC [Symbiodinium sp. CCMP2456]
MPAFGPTLGPGHLSQPQPDPNSNPGTPAATPAARKPPRASGPFVRGQCARLACGEVNYLLMGPPIPAPLVVCIHGLNGCISSFESVAPRLAESGFRVLCFDLYGFGLSAARGRLDLEAYVNQVSSLLQAVKVPPTEKVLLFGFSMGGVIAVEFALRHPERVAKLLLVAPGGLLQRSKTPCQPLLFGCLRTRLGGVLLAAATSLACCCSCCARRALAGDKLADRFELDVREPEKFKSVARQNGERFLWDLRRSVNSYLRVLRRMPLWSQDFQDSYARLARGSVPTLFIWGDSDCTVPFSEAEHAVRDLFSPAGVSCCMLPESGHGLLLEDAEQVSSIASAWFRDLKDPAWLAFLARWRLTPSSVAPAVLGAI